MRNQKPKLVLATLILAWLILPQAVSLAATYYVDADKGYDYNPGTIEQPFKTIQTGVDAATSGDTIIVYSGTYHEAVVINKENLTIMGEDPLNPPELDGADQNFNPTWEYVQGYIYKTDYQWYKSQLTQEQFNHYGGGHIPDRIAMQVYEDDILLRGYIGSYINGATNGYGRPYNSLDELDPMSTVYYPPSWLKQDIRIPGRFLYNESARELYVWSADEDVPSNHKYSIPVIENLIKIQAAYTTIQNFVIKNSAGWAVVIVSGADNANILNNFFINNMYSICVKHATNTTIARNFIQQRGIWERYWYYDCKDSVFWAHAIDLYEDDATRNTEIYKNVIYGDYSAMAIFSNTKVHDNIISNCMSTHINAEPLASNMYIYHNILHHVDDNSIGTSNQRNGPTWVYRNLFYHCWTFNKAGGSTEEYSKGPVYFYHNIFALGYLLTNHPYRYPIYKTHFFRNNIVYLKYLSNVENYFEYWNKDPAKGWSFFPFINGPDSDYNLYWEVNPDGPQGIAIFGLAGNVKQYAPGQFKIMQQETGLDPNGFEADPIFVNKTLFETLDMRNYKFDNFSDMDYYDVVAGGFDNLFVINFNSLFDLFKLSEDSPAINSGETLPADWPDIVEVTDGQPDIGAYEYVGLMYGDVSGDGSISAYDAALAAHIAVGLAHPDIKNPSAAEVSGDGEVSAYDAALIAQRAVGLIQKFPVEG